MATPSEVELNVSSIYPKHPERICWGCEKLCPANHLMCRETRAAHPVELFGDDSVGSVERTRSRSRHNTAMIQIGASAATIDTPIEHLMACHRRIEQRLETLLNAAGHVEKDRAGSLQAIRKSLEFLDTSGALHTQDEEASLFPRLRPKLSNAEAAFVDSLEAQHVEAGAVYADLKQLASMLDNPGGATADSIASYRDCAGRLQALYRDHIRAEDEILTALAKRSLGELEISAISREMRARRASPGKV